MISALMKQSLAKKTFIKYNHKHTEFCNGVQSVLGMCEELIRKTKTP